jgi:adenylate cyclase
VSDERHDDDDRADHSSGPGSHAGWINRFARLISGKPESDQASASDLRLRIEETLLGGPRRYTRPQLAEMIGADLITTTRLWRSLGFAEVSDEAVVFTDGDRQALEQVERLRSSGLIPPDLEEAVTRSVALAMSGLADWQVEMLYELVDYGHGGTTDKQILRISDQIVPLLHEMQTFVWRRHLAAAAGRLLASLPDRGEVRDVVIGFADMVGFTRVTRQLSPGELTVLIEEFQGAVATVVAGRGGRVVKTVGDEVLFVAERPAAGAEIALALLDRVAKSPTLPQLRIGLAIGPVVNRFGDVYGEAVNIAARLTTNARPGRILVDRNLAAAVEHDERFQLRLHRPLAVRGYRHLQPWGLRRAKPRSAPPPSPDDPGPA